MKILRIQILLSIAAFAIMVSAVAAQNQAGAILAVDEGAGSVSASSEKAGSGNISPKATRGRDSGQQKSAPKTTPRSTRTASVPKTARPYNGPILGDKYSFLNFEVISAEKPIYRRVAKQAGASGLVQVEVLVDTNGSVLSARARTGNKLLWDEAEKAALASRFNRPTANGQPARALGFLVYRFGAPEQDDDDDN